MKKLAFYILTILLVLGCKKDTDSFNDNFSFLYGNWIPYSLEVGMYSTHKPLDFGDKVLFIRNNSYKVIQDNIIIVSGKINIVTQTIDKLIINFIPKEYDPDDLTSIRFPRSDLILFVHNQDSISFFNQASDGAGFGLSLKKEK